MIPPLSAVVLLMTMGLDGAQVVVVIPAVVDVWSVVVSTSMSVELSTGKVTVAWICGPESAALLGAVDLSSGMVTVACICVEVLVVGAIVWATVDARSVVVIVVHARSAAEVDFRPVLVSATRGFDKLREVVTFE